MNYKEWWNETFSDFTEEHEREPTREEMDELYADLVDGAREMYTEYQGG